MVVVTQQSTFTVGYVLRFILSVSLCLFVSVSVPVCLSLTVFSSLIESGKAYTLSNQL